MNKEIDKEVVTKSLSDFSSEEASLLSAISFVPLSCRDIEGLWASYSGLSSASVRIMVQKLVMSGDLVLDDSLKLVLGPGIDLDKD